MSERPYKSLPAGSDTLFVVGIGASAGGLRALEDFFAHMPPDSGAAFVVVQHLSPDYKSLMKELLGRCTHMAIHRVEEGMPLASNSVYLIPPGQDLEVCDGQLHLTKQNRLNRLPNYPIDSFFESLARDSSESAVAIVLSGSGSDGSRGIQAIHQSGGAVLVQEPSTAEFDGMPKSALATGMAHRCLPPSELAQLVYSLARAPREDLATPEADPFVCLQEDHLRQILHLLAKHEGIDLRQYKTTTLNRRVQRRCLIVGYQNLDNYIEMLAVSSEERRLLREDLLISVTQFFRDPPAWEFLKSEIMPALVEDATEQAPLRVWVAACSTGQEAYSMAISIHEVAEALAVPVRAKIFATDLDRRCLEQAAQGIYPAAIAEEMSAERLERFFTPREDGTFEIVRSIREMIVFAFHNLVDDAVFSRMQLVSCRNVLIYMKPALQQQVLRNLHFSLNLHGILFLGESETLADLEEEFVPRDRRLKIYEKHRNVRLMPMVSRVSSALPAVAVAEGRGRRAPLPNDGSDRRLQAAFGLLLDDQKGCCLILDAHGRTLQVFGATPEILPPPNGPVSDKAIEMVAAPLQLPLSTALNHARKNYGKATDYGAVALGAAPDSPRVGLRVTLQKGGQGINEFAVVLIYPDTAAERTSRALSHEDIERATAQHIFDLESELQRNRESLQATIEELETTSEEQQATNEELIAANEELQSTNEELQSLNEELYTVNAEYQSKIQELTELNNDVNNLLRSTEIGTIFLDRDLCVRKYTPAATQVYALRPGDLGRPIVQLAHNLDLSDLGHHIQTVLETEVPAELKVKFADAERYLLLRLNPYCLEQGGVTGLVMTFIDITPMQTAQRALRNNNILLNTVIDSMPDPVFLKDLSGRYQLANAAVARAVGKPLEEIIGKTDCELFPEEVARQNIKTDREILTAGEALTYEEALARPDGQMVFHLTTKVVLRDEDGHPTGLVGLARDITPLKRAQQHLERANQDLHREADRRQAAMLEARANEHRFRNTFEQAAVGIANVAPDGTLLRINQRFADIVGYTKAELIEKTFQDITHPDDLAGDLDNVRRTLAGEISGYEMNKRYFHKDGSIVWVKLTVGLVRDDSDEPRYFVAVIQDITQQAQLEIENQRILRELIREKELAQVTLHSIGDAVITTNSDAQIQYCNPVAEKLAGCSTTTVKGQPIHEVITLLAEDTREPISDAEFLATDNAEHLILVSSDGLEYVVSKSVAQMCDAQGSFLGVVVVLRDNTESRELSWQACHDALTGLLNRHQFERELDHAVASVQVDDRREHTLCIADLDRFKLVNDTVGHLAGDALLRQVAMLMEQYTRASDCVARLGGDEFGIILQDCPISRGEAIIELLRQAVSEFCFVWEERTFTVGLSIGLVAVNASTVHSQPGIINLADAACYSAKKRGRNCLHVYSPENTDLDCRQSDRAWSTRIAAALERNAFYLCQQPIVRTQQIERVEGYELLVRMLDNDGSTISPSSFIPAAERYNLMPRIDRWVVEYFLNYVEANPSDRDCGHYAINLSGTSFTDRQLLDFLKVELAARPELAPKICFEITETAAISNLSEAVKFINALRDVGCSFALDDFGSGMSSFGYLKTLPVNYIKIDGRFIKDIETDSAAKIIVESICNIGRVLGLETIAEFVEDERTLRCLQDIGVDYVQGYLIAPPQPLGPAT